MNYSTATMQVIRTILESLGITFEQYLPTLESKFNIVDFLNMVLDTLLIQRESIDRLANLNADQARELSQLRSRLDREPIQPHVMGVDRLIYLLSAEHWASYGEDWGLNYMQLTETCRLLAKGQKIEAIKLLKQYKNLGLYDAKILAENMIDDVPF